MPIMDAQLLFGESIDLGGLTSGGSPAVSTNNVYIPAVNDHTGTSRTDRPNVSGDLYWNTVVEDEALDASGDSGALTMSLYGHSAAITASNYGSGTLIDSITITVDSGSANYPDGAQIASRALPQGALGPYFAVIYSVATKDMAAGKVTSWIGNAIQQGGEHGAL